MNPAPRRSSARASATRPSAVAKGPPRWMTFGVPGETLESLAAQPIEATLKGAKIVQVSLSGLADASLEGPVPRIRVVVDPLTPPGRYEGTATIGENTIPLVAEVEPTVRVRTDPSRIEVQATAGETVKVTVRLQNLGNVPTDVPATTSFALLDRSGFGDAFNHALAEPPPEGKQRIDVLFDDLALSHGGEVLAAAVKDTDGPIQPGTIGTIELALTFSDRLKPGAEYAGSWNIDATHVPVRVTVPAVDVPAEEPPPTRTPARAKKPKPAKETPS